VVAILGKRLVFDQAGRYRRNGEYGGQEETPAEKIELSSWLSSSPEFSFQPQGLFQHDNFN
jgi:hypothetical protein